MPVTTKIALCAIENCGRVGRVKRDMCYRCYQKWLKDNPNQTSFTETGKVCRKCERDKPLTEYTRESRNSSGLHARCKACVKEQQRQRRAQHPSKVDEYNQRWMDRCVGHEYAGLSDLERRKLYYRQTGRNSRLKAKYGITSSEYDAMFAAQDGACAICRRTDCQLHIDHSHKPGGKVRGLLNGQCNRGLGLFGDDPDRLMAAATYLLKDVDVLSSLAAGGVSLQ